MRPGDPQIYVSQIIPGQVAALDGRLRVSLFSFRCELCTALPRRAWLSSSSTVSKHASYLRISNSKVGDIIIAVNGSDMKSMSHNTASRLLSVSAPSVRLTIKRFVGKVHIKLVRKLLNISLRAPCILSPISLTPPFSALTIPFENHRVTPL